MKFLVDESLSPKLAEFLGAAGHDAVHVRDRGLQGAQDVAVLSLAEQEDRILISADADFGGLLTLGSRRKPSLVLFRGAFKPRAHDQGVFLTSSLSRIAEHLQRGAIVVLTGARIRIREL